MLSIVGEHWVEAIALGKVLKNVFWIKKTTTLRSESHIMYKTWVERRCGVGVRQRREINADYVLTKYVFIYIGAWRCQQSLGNAWRLHKISNKTCFFSDWAFDGDNKRSRPASKEHLKCYPTLYKPKTFGNVPGGSRISRNELGVLRKRWRNLAECIQWNYWRFSTV